MKIYLFITGFLFCTLAIAQDEKSPDDFFKDSTVLSFNDKTDPRDIIGALVYYKDQNKTDWKYVNLYTTGELAKIEPQENQAVIYEDMVKKEVLASIKYLKIFSADVKANELLQVVMTDQYDLKVDSFLSNPAIRQKVLEEARWLYRQGYHVEYIDKVNQTIITTKLFKEGAQQIGFNYYASGEAKNYTATSKYTVKKLVSVHSVLLDPFLKDEKIAVKLESLRSPGRDYMPNLSNQ